MAETGTQQRELSLLLRASQPFSECPQRDEDLPDFDWRRFLDLAFRHRVAALVGIALLRGGWIEPDSRYEYVQDALLGAYVLNERRNRILLAEASRLVKLLHAAGIEVALRKGAYLAPAVYRDAGLRPMSDIDLFVDRGASGEVAAVLEGAGYTPGNLDASGQVNPLSRRQAVFWNVHVNTLPTHHRLGKDRSLRSIAVDVCFDLFLPAGGCHLPADRLLGETVPFEIDGEVARAFRAEHFLFDVAVHLYKESTTLRYIERGKHQRLLQYVDIVAVVRKHPTLDWDVVVETAAEAGAARDLYFALANTELLYPSTVPAAVLDRLASIGQVHEDFLREYGAIDLPEPLVWSARSLTERLFSDEEPGAESRSPV